MFTLSDLNKDIDDDLYIKILKYAEENQEDGFTLNELSDEFDLTSDQILFLRREVSDDGLFRRTSRTRNTEYGNEHILFPSVEDKFRLLEYRELKEARMYSFISLMIASFAILVSVIVGLYQIYTPQEVKIVPEEKSKEITQEVLDE